MEAHMGGDILKKKDMCKDREDRNHVWEKWSKKNGETGVFFLGGGDVEGSDLVQGLSISFSVL